MNVVKCTLNVENYFFPKLKCLNIEKVREFTPHSETIFGHKHSFIKYLKSRASVSQLVSESVSLLVCLSLSIPGS